MLQCLAAASTRYCWTEPARSSRLVLAGTVACYFVVFVRPVRTADLILGALAPCLAGWVGMEQGPGLSRSRSLTGAHIHVWSLDSLLPSKIPLSRATMQREQRIPRARSVRSSRP